MDEREQECFADAKPGEVFAMECSQAFTLGASLASHKVGKLMKNDKRSLLLGTLDPRSVVASPDSFRRLLAIQSSGFLNEDDGVLLLVPQKRNGIAWARAPWN